MTFNENSRIDSSKVKKRGRGTAVAAGGGGLLVLAAAIIGPLIGFDLTPIVGLFGGGGGTSSSDDTVLEGCDTGADANANAECRMAGAADSLDEYWSETLPALGVDYVSPEVILFEGGTQSGCGAASSATGPFYCPTDQTIYMDVSFFDQLRTDFGASAGPLSQMYVAAHEWGHHIQNISGIMSGLDLRATGPASDSVRLELQADCFAGAWVAEASGTSDDAGNRLLEPPTREQIADALDAASRIGDDSIQESAGQAVNPEAFSHGSSEQRQRWFSQGYEDGPDSCSTFDVTAAQL